MKGVRLLYLSLLACAAVAFVSAGAELLTEWFARSAPAESAGGGSLVFNGSNYVEIANSSTFYATSGQSNFTWEAWFKSDASGWAGLLFAADAAASSEGWYTVFLNGNPYTRWFAPGTCLGGQAAAHYPFHSGDWRVTNVCDGAWHHWAVVMSNNGTNMQDYLDGVAYNNGGSCTQVLLSASAPLFIGRAVWVAAHWQGNIAEVRLSNTARYTGNFTPATSFTVDANTVAYYNFSDGSGSTLTDQSGNGHHGTLKKATPGSWQNIWPGPAPGPDYWMESTTFQEINYTDNLDATYSINDGGGMLFTWTGAASGITNALHDLYVAISSYPPAPSTGYSTVMEDAYAVWTAAEPPPGTLPEWSTDHP